MKTFLVALVAYTFYRLMVQWRLHQKSFWVQLRDMDEGAERFALVLGHALLPAMEEFCREVQGSVERMVVQR